MTAVAERWWAPEAPGIGPDAFDLSLFEPGNEPDKDLGLHLLALHRTGAAACRAVATQPLADESVLCEVLAAARKLVAPAAATAVSKAVDDGRYGALLVRDVLDDAEQAALSLYRSCIAKRVSPPAAAERVAKVYGLPLRELGRYTALATDPASKDATLDDVADRALFAYVARLVAEEGVVAKVEVSKAREDEGGQAQQRRTARETPAGGLLRDYHGKEAGERDAQGQFARVSGAAALARAKLAAAAGKQEQAVPTTARQARTVPKRRAARSLADIQRAAAARQAPVAAERAGVERAGVERSGTTRAGRERSGTVRSPMQRFDTMPPFDPDPPPLPPKPHRNNAGLPRDVPDMLERVGDATGHDYALIMQPLSFVLPYDEWSEAASYMGKEQGSLLFRQGALESYVGGHVIHKDEDGYVTDEHIHEVESVADRVKSELGFAVRSEDKGKPGFRPDPMVKLIGDDVLSVLPGKPTASEEAALKREKEKFLSEVFKTADLSVFAGELNYVQHGASKQNPHQMALVYMPPQDGRPLTDREFPRVVEVVVEEDDARGVDLTFEGAKHREFALDPNQPMQAFTGRDAVSTFWDEKLGVFRTQIQASQAYEEDLERAAKARSRGKGGFGFRKSASLIAVPISKVDEERFAQLERSGRIQRDDQGQFVSAEVFRSIGQQAPPQAAEAEEVAEEVKPAQRRMARSLKSSKRRMGRSLNEIKARSAQPQSEAVARAAELAGLARAGVQRSGIERSGVQRASTARSDLVRAVLDTPYDPTLADDKQPVHIDPAWDYIRLTDRQVSSLMRASNVRHGSDIYDTSKPWDLGLVGSSWLLGVDGVDGVEVPNQLAQQTEEDYLALPPVANGPEWRPVVKTRVFDERGFDDIAAQVAERLEATPGAQRVRLLVVADGDDWKVEVLVNQQAMSPQYLARWQSKGAKGAVRMQYEGAKRLVSAKGMAGWMKLRFHNTAGLDRTKAGLDDTLENPLIHSYVIEDANGR